MSANIQEESLEQRLIKKISDLEQIVQEIRTNQVKKLIQESYIQGHPQWDNSWTQSDSYVDITGSLRQINFDDYKNNTYYFEMIAKVDDGTGYFQVMNADTSVALSGSELITTSTSPVRLRTGAVTKPTGTVNLKLQHKQTGGAGTGFVNSIMSSHVFRVS